MDSREFWFKGECCDCTYEYVCIYSDYFKSED